MDEDISFLLDFIFKISMEFALLCSCMDLSMTDIWLLNLPLYSIILCMIVQLYCVIICKAREAPMLLWRYALK